MCIRDSTHTHNILMQVEKLQTLYNVGVEKRFVEECVHVKTHLLTIEKEYNQKVSYLPFLCKTFTKKKGKTFKMSTQMCTLLSKFQL